MIWKKLFRQKTLDQKQNPNKLVCVQVQGATNGDVDLQLDHVLVEAQPRLEVSVLVVAKAVRLVQASQVSKNIYSQLMAVLQKDIAHVAKPEEFLKKQLATLSAGSPDVKLDVLVLVWLGEEVLIAGLGQVRVFLARTDRFGSVYKSSPEIVTTAIGLLKQGDVLIGTNQDLLAHVGPKKLQQIALNRDPNTIAEQLVVAVNDHPGAAALVTSKVCDLPETPKSPDKVYKSRGIKLSWPRPKLKPVESRIAQKRKRLNLLLLLVLLFMLATYGSWLKKRQGQTQELLTSWQEKVNQVEAQALAEEKFSKIKARELVQATLKELELVMNEKQPKKVMAELERWQEELRQVEAQVSGEVAADPRIFFDLSLVSQEINADKISADENRLVALDSSNQLMLELQLPTKQASLVSTGSDLRGAKSLVVAASGDYVLTPQGVWRVGAEAKVVLAPESAWQDVALLAAFGDNLYVLDRSLGEVWRYNIDLWRRERWLATGETPDFAGVADMKIDGDIWVLFNDGRLIQFSRGRQQSFSLEVLETPITEATRVVVTSRQVWVLDKGASRLLEYDRNGQFTKEYTSEIFGSAHDMAGYDNSVLLLSGKIIYQAP